ncbi:hypothetical protein KW785_03590 [Candidatus Parcubacteria bacterium]|nr:hypothetical protein [Candidatus Parcubacteria bacterium]
MNTLALARELLKKARVVKNPSKALQALTRSLDGSVDAIGVSESDVWEIATHLSEELERLETPKPPQNNPELKKLAKQFRQLQK